MRNQRTTARTHPRKSMKQKQSQLIGRGKTMKIKATAVAVVAAAVAAQKVNQMQSVSGQTSLLSSGHFLIDSLNEIYLPS